MVQRLSGLNTSPPRYVDFLWYWLPPLAWCWAVLIMSGDLGSTQNTGTILEWLLSWFPPLSPAQFKLLHFYVRKTVGHFGNYAFLYFLWFRAFQGQLRWPLGRAFFLSLACCLAVALLDEGRQSLFASRGSSLRDVALDLTGASVAALVIWIFWTPRIRPPAEKYFF